MRAIGEALAVALALYPMGAAAQTAPTSTQAPALPSTEPLPDLPESLSQLLDAPVSIASKSDQRAAQAPAVVTIVTAREIEARGYTSLADILRAVPGFYDVYNLVTHNVGVRGTNGGPGASGNVIKLMIDGHPVDYRPTTGNFFGEELIPIQAIGRVEIIRGPASALYGANAFLGVVNVITRSAADVEGMRLWGEGVVRGYKLGGGGGAVVGATTPSVNLLLGASYLRLDRSGLELPGSSPILPSDLSMRSPSQNDYARPATFLGKLVLTHILYGTLSLLASVQSLDVNGEFEAFQPLTHDTRTALVNQNYRLSYEVSPIDEVALTFSAHYFDATPRDVSLVDAGRPDYILRPYGGAHGFGGAAEARIKLDPFMLVVGSDWVREHHTFRTYDRELTEDITAPDGTIIRSAGTIIPGEAHGRTATFDNLGAFGQVVVSLTDDLSAIAGTRVDLHSIYGTNPSFRGGFVYSPQRRPLSLKLLYGSSFKAPSAVQLYATPVGRVDLIGNPDLKAQVAHTVELAAGVGLGDLGELSVNIFATYILQRVEFIQDGDYIKADNRGDEWIGGGEAQARLNLAPGFNLTLSTGVARTLADTSSQVLVVVVPQVRNSLFPFFQGHAIGDYAVGWNGLHLALEVSYVGPRSTSQSNALIKSASYDLPGYVYTGAAVFSSFDVLGRQTRVSLRVTDVLNVQWTEPGFAGVDVPTLGRTIIATVTQAL